MADGKDLTKADEGFGDRLGEQLADKLMAIGIDGVGPLGSAKAAADEVLREEGSVDAAIRKIVAGGGRTAAVNGFVTGLGGFITLPVTLPANVVGFYVSATRMVAQIAHLRGYDVSRPDVRSAILLTLVGADAKKMLGRFGAVASGGPVTALATRGLPEPVLMMINKTVAFRLITRVGTRAVPRFGKLVPVVGGVIGATLDDVLMHRIAKGAQKEFPQLGA